MRWSVAEDFELHRIGWGARIYVDGEEVDRVTAFDTEEGWVTAYCTDGHTGYPGEAHLAPGKDDEVCRVRYAGEVTFVPGEGAHL